MLISRAPKQSAQRTIPRGIAIGAAKSPPSASGLERYLAGLNVSVGDEASSREDLMVEIRVAVADATVANELLPRLSAPLDRSSISFDGTVPIASPLAAHDARHGEPAHGTDGNE